MAFEITANNGRSLLESGLAIDYQTRTRILQVCSPEMETYEAYHEGIAGRWIAERVAVHANIFANYVARAFAYSRSLPPSAPHVVAVVGNTGVGKTEYFRKLFPEGIEAALNVDVIKAKLKKRVPFPLTNRQVHREGAFICALLVQAVAREAIQLKIAIDARFRSWEEERWKFIDPIERRAGRGCFYDLDGSLTTSINRVLARDPYGEEPCVPLSAIVEGFLDARGHREELIERIREHPEIDYQLYCTNEVGHKVLVAQQKESVFTIYRLKEFDQALQTPTESEIRSALKGVIDDAYIEEAVRKGDIQLYQTKYLERWRGKTLTHAMGRHVRGYFAPDYRSTAAAGIIQKLRDFKREFQHKFRSILDIENTHFSDLFLAVKKGDLPALESILDGIEEVRGLSDLVSLAALFGQTRAVDQLLLRGVAAKPAEAFDVVLHAWVERLTPLGHAMYHRRYEAAQMLIAHGMNVEEVSRQIWEKPKALDLFFSRHKQEGPDLRFLQFLLSNGAAVSKLERATLFAIGVYASAEEVEALSEAGFDLNSLVTDSTNLLDVALMQEEKANRFVLDEPSKQKVALLLKKSLQPKKWAPKGPWTYVEPHSLPRAFWSIWPGRLDLTDPKQIDSYYAKIKAATAEEGRWTILHHLFATLSEETVSDEVYEFISVANSPLIRLVDLLIARGAKPTKDLQGRTPLMCLSLNAFHRGFNRQVIERYIDFEAEALKIGRKAYCQGFQFLRDEGFTTQEMLVGSLAVPNRGLFERVWRRLVD